MLLNAYTRTRFNEQLHQRAPEPHDEYRLIAHRENHQENWPSKRPRTRKVKFQQKQGYYAKQQDHAVVPKGKARKVAKLYNT